ncbi:MAG: glycoside hydrolase family 38 C-terminal domain-containing protein, partial [Hungatella sp.]
EIPIEVLDCATKEVIASQVSMTARAVQVEIIVQLKPKEIKEVKICLSKKHKIVTIQNHAYVGADGVEDLLLQGLRRDLKCVETPYFKVLFNCKQGVYSIFDKKRNVEIVRGDAVEAPFSGIYEVSNLSGDACETRRRMGRNRKSYGVKRYYAELSEMKILETGDIYTAIRLDYNLEGTGFYQVFLKIYQSVSKIEARVRVHKCSVWEPENLYISLPFTAGEDTTLYLDKTGCMIRPGIDQLPGTNQEFYLLQTGAVLEGKNSMTVISIQDAPLVTLGNLNAGPICLCDGNDRKKNQSQMYSWVMNNYWETNFKADLGGFYEFIYMIDSIDLQMPKDAFKLCEANNEGLLGFYSKPD